MRRVDFSPRELIRQRQLALLFRRAIESFNRDSKRSACRAADTRSSPDIPAKIGLRRLSGMSCESRLNDLTRITP